MTVIYPGDHKKYFEDIRSRLSIAPLTIAEMCYLKDTLEDEISMARKEIFLFTSAVDGQERESVRQQYHVLCQVLELNSKSASRLIPSAIDGELTWALCDRRNQANALLVLTVDSVWEVRHLPVSDRRLGFMSHQQKLTTLSLENVSLRSLLERQQVDLQDLGGWKIK